MLFAIDPQDDHDAPSGRLAGDRHGEIHLSLRQRRRAAIPLATLAGTAGQHPHDLGLQCRSRGGRPGDQPGPVEGQNQTPALIE